MDYEPIFELNENKEVMSKAVHCEEMNKHRVIKIIDDTQIVINVGINHKLKAGGLIEIYLPASVDVIDPDTKEHLGSLDYVKETLTAVTVYPKMTVCKKLIYKPLFPDISDELTGVYKKNSFWSAYHEAESNAETFIADKLNVVPEHISDDFEDFDSAIRVGDLCRLVTKQEDDT